MSKSTSFCSIFRLFSLLDVDSAAILSLAMTDTTVMSLIGELRK